VGYKTLVYIVKFGMIKFYTGILLILFLLTGCDKWNTTQEVSHNSELPVFTLKGGEFISVSKSDSGEYTEPGVTAKSGESELSVYSYTPVKIELNKVGVYNIFYTAQNADGLQATAQRIIAVTDVDVTNNDLSGTYTGTLWTTTEATVKKIDPKGLYKTDDVMGYPGASMPGKFVDIGNNKLVLINGTGYFGRYKSSEGTYSRSTLSWTVSLTDDPYNGIELPVLWRKKD
jgi:hypothetical protein